MGQGLFHIKVPVSYLHANELVPNDSKVFVMSVITAFDASSLALMCLGLKLGYSFQTILEFFFYLGLFASALYLLVLPESPIFYFLNEGSKSKNGIDALNYIAWFNKS